MKKKVYSKLLVLTALGSVAFTGVAAGVMSVKEDEAPIATKAEDLAFFEWKGKFAGGWNPNPGAIAQDLCSYIIALNGSGFPKVDGSNLRDIPESGGQVTINGVALNALENKHNVAFDHSQNNQYVLLRFRKDQVVALEGKDYCEVHINEGTVFDGYKLRELTLHINPSTYVATIVPSKKHNTNVVGIKPYEIDAGWFRIDLEGYPTQKKNDTVTVYNYLNFANKIYVNGDPSNLLLTPNQESYSMTFNVAGCNGLSFNGSKLAVPVADINSVTIPAGTEFPGKAGDGSADYENYYVTQKDQTFIRYGNDFFEEVSTNVTEYYPAVWGGGQRGFKLEGFTDDSESGGDKSGRPFNFITNIYINKDKSQLLSQYNNRAATYYKIGHANTFGTLLCQDFHSSQENYVTIPAGTQFPDSKAWKGEVGGKVFVTKDEVTFAKQYSGPRGTNTEFSGYKYKKVSEIKESVNYGLTSFEGFTGSTEDYISGGQGMTNFPLNNNSPFGDTNVDFKFKINNSVDNNFSGSFYMSSTGVCDDTKGGYEFKFAKTSIGLYYNKTQIGSTIYHTPDLPQFLDGEDINIEICVIKTDATHVRLAFLMNDVALIDVVRDCSNDVMGTLNSAKMFTTTDNPIVFKNVDVDDEALDRFLTKALKMDDEGATAADNYDNAVSYLNTNLTKKQKQLFYTSNKYSAALARLETWAQEKGEHAILTANFTGINQWNNNIDVKDQVGIKRAYLEFDAKPLNGFSSENIAGSSAFINGVNCNTIENFKMYCLDNSGNFVMMDYPATALTTTEAYPYTYFHADAGIKTPEVYPWTTLGEINMYLNGEGKWVKVSGIHTVTVTHDGDVKTMYIPDGATVPAKDLSKYCSYAYTVDGQPFDLATPIIADTDILLETVEHDYSKVEAKESSCTEKGNIEYFECLNSDCDKVFLYEDGNYVEVSMDDVLLDLADHTVDPESVTFAFAADGSSVKVTYKCSQCKDTFTVPSEEVTLVSIQTKAPTCLEKGETTYTATWGEYSDTLTLPDIPATGHKWDVTVTWDGKFAEANASCEHTGCQETLYEKKEATYVKDTDATCHSYETGHLEVTFDNTNLGSAQTEKDSFINVDAGKPSHYYGDVSYEWSTDNANCVAKQECLNDGCEESKVENGLVTYKVITEPTPSTKGLGRYTATFETLPSTTKDVQIDYTCEMTLSQKVYMSYSLNGEQVTNVKAGLTFYFDFDEGALDKYYDAGYTFKFVYGYSNEEMNLDDLLASKSTKASVERGDSQESLGIKFGNNESGQYYRTYYVAFVVMDGNNVIYSSDIASCSLSSIWDEYYSSPTTYVGEEAAREVINDAFLN